MQHTRSSHDPVLCRPSLKGWGITSSLLVICCEPCSMRSLIQAVPSTAQSHRWHHPDRRSWMAQTTGAAFQSRAVRDCGPREPHPRQEDSLPNRGLPAPAKSDGRPHHSQLMFLLCCIARPNPCFQDAKSKVLTPFLLRMKLCPPTFPSLAGNPVSASGRPVGLDPKELIAGGMALPPATLFMELERGTESRRPPRPGPFQSPHAA